MSTLAKISSESWRLHSRLLYFFNFRLNLGDFIRLLYLYDFCNRQGLIRMFLSSFLFGHVNEIVLSDTIQNLSIGQNIFLNKLKGVVKAYRNNNFYFEKLPLE